jgi:hypothetical protein
MVLNPTFADVRRVAVKREPEIFNKIIAECFEDSTIEFVTGGVRCPGNQISLYRMAEI